MFMTFKLIIDQQNSHTQPLCHHFRNWDEKVASEKLSSISSHDVHNAVSNFENLSSIDVV
jgi:hypothetical protein